MTSLSQRPGYFDRLYADNPDPWGFETRDYERAKYAATLEALPAKRFLSGLEVGCSIGVLTEQLGRRCDTLLGVDVVPAALDRARERCRNSPGIRFAMSTLPSSAPPGPFDLIVLSEILYYFPAPGIAMIARLLISEMSAEAVIVLVHWLGATPDYPMTGETAVAAFQAAIPDFMQLVHQRTPQYRLDIHVRSA